MRQSDLIEDMIVKKEKLRYQQEDLYGRQKPEAGLREASSCDSIWPSPSRIGDLLQAKAFCLGSKVVPHDSSWLYPRAPVNF